MTLEEIKTALVAGRTVHYMKDSATVGPDGWIACRGPSGTHLLPLILNGELRGSESDYYIAGTRAADQVVYRQIPPETVDIYRHGAHFATVNQYEFNDLRIQIREQHVTHFSIRFEGVDYPIDADGRSKWPPGLFELFQEQLRTLLVPRKSDSTPHEPLPHTLSA